jgi:hypothetical protein
MQRVTIDYRQIDFKQLWQSLLPRWPKRLLQTVLLSLGISFFLSPLLMLFAWEQRWISLVYLQVVFLSFALHLNRQTAREWLEKVQRIPATQLSIQPEGLEDFSEHSSHSLQGWRLFKAVQRKPLIMFLPFEDHGKALAYIIPSASFPSGYEADAFAQAATDAIAAQAAAPPVASAPYFNIPAGERYRWNYQLTRAELFTDDAKAELRKLHPDHFPAAGEPSTKPGTNWKLFAFIGLFFAISFVESKLIEVRSSGFEFFFLIGGFVYLKVMASLQSWLAAWIRQLRKTPAPPVEVCLSNQGIFRSAPEELLHYPWSGIDSLLMHNERLTLWKGDSCRLIIPQRVFDSPEQAHECERWIQGILQKQFNRLAVAELAEPEPAIALPAARPASNNPYQAPQL